MLGGGVGTFDFWFNIPTDLNCSTGCSPAFRLNPATEDGVPVAEWVLADDVAYNMGSSNLTVCSVTQTYNVGTATLPFFTCIFQTLAGYANPTSADQPGNPGTIYPGQSFKQIDYRAGRLYLAMPTAITCGSIVEDGILWADVDPFVQNGAVPQTVGGLQGTTDAGYVCYNFGGIRHDAYMPTYYGGQENDAVLVYNYSSTNDFPGIVWDGRQNTEPTSSMGQGSTGVFVVGGSSTNLTGRWGHYSACSLTINSVTRGIMYCAGEYGGADPLWNTWNYELRVE